MSEGAGSASDFNHRLSGVVALLLANFANHKGVEVALFRNDEISESNLAAHASKFPDEPLIFIVNTLNVMGVVLTWGRERLFSYAIYSDPVAREILELRDVPEILQRGKVSKGIMVAYRLPEEARRSLLETLGSVTRIASSFRSVLSSEHTVVHLSEHIVKQSSRIMTTMGVSSELEAVTIDKYNKTAYVKVAGDYDAGDMLLPSSYIVLVLLVLGVKLERLIVEIRDKKQISLTIGRAEKISLELSKEFLCSLRAALYVGTFSGLILRAISLAKERGGYILDTQYDTPALAIEPEFIAMKIKRFLQCMENTRCKVRLHIVQKVGGLIRNLTAEA